MRIRDGKKIAHEGIKVEFVGSIGVFVLSPVLVDLPSPLPQSSFMTEVTIMNSSLSHKNSPRQGRCGRHRRSISCSKT